MSSKDNESIYNQSKVFDKLKNENFISFLDCYNLRYSV